MATQPNDSGDAASSVFAQPREPILAGPADQSGELLALHPNVLRVWRLSAAIGAAIFGTLAVGGGAAGALGLESGAYVFATISGSVAALFLWSAVQFCGWRYDAWRYGVRAHDVVAGFGVFWRTRRCVPRLRIQHVDIASGPIDRMFGMANVSLFTAGNIAAVITIPGVTPEEAERLRATLLNLEPSDERRPAPPASGQHAG
jgi:membrane protein YdbS with pleckstrin-like domain